MRGRVQFSMIKCQNIRNNLRRHCYKSPTAGTGDGPGTRVHSNFRSKGIAGVNVEVLEIRGIPPPRTTTPPWAIFAKDMYFFTRFACEGFRVFYSKAAHCRDCHSTSNK